MEVTYRVERKDLWYGAWYTNFHHPQARLIWLVSLVWVALIAGPGISEHHYLAAGIGLAVYLVVFPIAFFITIAIQVFQRMPSANTVRWCTEVIDPWGFRCFVPEGERRATWQQVRRIAETPGYFFVFATGGKGYLIPKRAFASPAHADAYRQQAFAYWNAAKSGTPLAPTPIQSMGVPQVGYSAGDPAPGVWPPAPRVG